MTLTDLPLSIVALKAWPLRAPIQTPRRNAFGVQAARSALFVEMTLSDGSVGWGEAFANWPQFAAQHRARIVEEIAAPLIIGRDFTSPAALWEMLDLRLAALSIQCAEPGPFQSVIAGIEIAAWNAVAYREQCTLVSLLGGEKGQPIPYASGLTGPTLRQSLPGLIDAGWTAYKLKVGFGYEADRAALDTFREIAGPEPHLMVDANMAWDLPAAIEAVEWMCSYDINWVEEPIRADSPPEYWRELAQACSVKLAAGENLRGHRAFDAIASAGARVIQPDAVKWGGLAQTMAIGQRCRKQDLDFAPHFLGGCIGLEATRALARASGAAFLEIDVTENPLRSGSSIPSIPEPNGAEFGASEFNVDLMAPFLVDGWRNQAA